MAEKKPKEAMKKNWKPYSVRIQPSLEDWIKEDADRESRSVAQEIDYLIRRGIYVRQAELELIARHKPELKDNETNQKGDGTAKAI